MYEIGRICVKIAGRDAGLKCVVVDVVDAHTVLIDGQTRRRKCNVKHLELSSQVIKIKKGASTKEVYDEFKKLKIDVRETKPKKAAPRPVKQKKKSSVDVKSKKADKKTDKKAEKSVKETPKVESKKEESKTVVSKETNKESEKESEKEIKEESVKPKVSKDSKSASAEKPKAVKTDKK